jgi:hypothetical protein
MQLLTIPGYTGSGPGHWQSIWERSDPSIRRVEQRDWNRPAIPDWTDTIENAVRQAEGRCILIAHSCGVTAVAHWAARSPSKIAGAFLVAPPDSDRDDLEAPVRGFRLPPIRPLPFPALVVASQNDPTCDYSRAAEFAVAWGARLLSAGLAGHLNTASGHGPWPEGRRMYEAFRLALA